MKGIKINTNISWNEKVSSGLCFILIILLSLIIAWHTVNTAEKVLSSAPDSKVFNIEKRADIE